MSDPLAALEQAIARDPADVGAWHERGTALFMLGRMADALASYERVIALAPQLAEPHDNRGLVLQRLGRFGEAIDSHAAAIARNPGFATAYLRRAMALREFGRFDEALQDAGRAVALQPSAAALNGRGVVHDDLGQLEAAVADFRAALRLAPDFVPARNNLGNALHGLGRYREALAEFDAALGARPEYAEALSNRALALQELGRFDEAMAGYDAALAAAPRLAEARKRRAALQLLRGDFAAGWDDYDHAVQAARARQRANGELPSPPWWEGQSLSGKSILVSEPNGLGDLLQYWRFVPVLEAMGARVACAAPVAMRRLLRTSPWQPAWADAAAGEFDFQTPLWSVPRILRLDAQAIPAPVPYLRAEPGAVARWERLLQPGAINIGINWQGKPGRKIDAGRSIPLAAFLPLAQVPGVRLVSLQRKVGLDQLEGLPQGMQVIDPGPEFDAGPDAFVDTAALVARLDLVVSSDSAVVHLAGAMGRPAWLALRHVPEWRWMLDRADSPWYPSMRLFRQPRPGDWPAVFAAIADAVQRR